MNILLLDVYPDVNYRISKDQNGGYGTANNYGDTITSKIIKKLIKKNLDFPPLYSVYVIGELKNQGHNIQYARKLLESDIESYDLFIVTSSIVCHETELEVIKKLKFNKKPVISIGPFATNYSEPYLSSGAKVIIGEPEMFFHSKKLNTIEDFKNLPNKINDFTASNINSLSKPGWDVIFKNLKPRFSFLGKGLAINIQSSRGCPYSCRYYCVYPLQQGHKLRLREPEKVVDEMLFFKKHFNVNNFIFRDPVFAINKSHALELCQRIISTGKKFNIAVETHLKIIDENLTKVFAKAGIKLIYVGIETINKDVIENSKRASENLQSQFDKVNMLEKNNIMVKAMFIIGMPGDTISSFEDTFEYAKKLDPTFAQFSVFTPYPGTPIYNEYLDKLNFKKFEEFTQWNLIFKHKNFKKEEVRNILDKSIRKFYLRPKWIKKFLKKGIYKTLFFN